MNYEKEIKDLRKQLNNLQDAFLTSIKNNTSVVDKVDTTANQVVSITPFIESKQAYIGDTECMFTKAKDGNISAWIEIDGVQTPCAFVAEDDKIKVEFEALEKVAIVSISIQ